MRYMLDTNTVSDIARHRSKAARTRLELCEAGQVSLSIITLAEALYDLAKRSEALRLRRAVNVLINVATVEPWTRSEAEVYGDLRAGLEQSGIVIGQLDLLIAAHAMSRNAVLVTRDKAFRRIPGLNVETWASDLH